jgi:hypothetical protein
MPSNDQENYISLFKIVRDNQELYIKQQWRITYYAVLLYSAIFYLRKVIDGHQCHLNLAVLVVAVFSLAMISICECSLCESRRSADKISHNINSFEQFIERSNGNKSFVIFILLFSINLLSAVFVIWAISIYKP